MSMKLVETTFSESTVHMQLADNAELEKATEWVEFEVPVAPLMLDANNPLGDPATRHLATTQRAALLYVREAISEEIRRLSTLIDR